ncbi:hypothetical protein PFISCL1PPCAC_22142, partial [Pristionchus fissidentatus]
IRARSKIILVQREESRVKEMKSYELLAIACESGDVKFIDTAVYRTPLLRPLPIPTNNAAGSNIVVFCTAWSVQAREKQVSSIDNLFGIYALTAQGRHVFRAFSGPDNKTVITTVIASDVIGQSSYVTRWMATFVAAYGANAVHVSVHRPTSRSRVSVHRLATTVPISACFMHSKHLVVASGEIIAIVCTWALTKGFTRGAAVRKAEESHYGSRCAILVGVFLLRFPCDVKKKRERSRDL